MIDFDEAGNGAHEMPAAPIGEISSEYLRLRDEIGRLAAITSAQTYNSNREAESEAAIGAILDRMSYLATQASSSPSGCPQDLAQKARLVMDWIDEDGDISVLLVASLCRDVVALFSPAEDFA